MFFNLQSDGSKIIRDLLAKRWADISRGIPGAPSLAGLD
ncbi:hypothetical protein D1AOALGA4SA_7936 [Olavius algarvensis Delta 1 endosymbiont]|nr:hypothetical protein D1AOALGA4SA_7936 [Olavius algarvensis Delta 1 endosymbiont]